MKYIFEIKKELGVISSTKNGWQKELNLVSWNEKEPKYDIREWSPDHERMSKGCTFTLSELLILRKLLNDLDQLNVNITIDLSDLK